MSVCRGKLAFNTLEQAERTVAVVAALRPGSKAPVRTYECPRCGHLHFTSKTEAEVGRHASTAAHIGPAEPAFTVAVHVPPPAPARKRKAVAVLENPCAGCGEGGAKFDMRGALYHRRCRTQALTALPPADRRALLIEWANAGQRGTKTVLSNLERTGAGAAAQRGEGG